MNGNGFVGKYEVPGHMINAGLEPILAEKCVATEPILDGLRITGSNSRTWARDSQHLGFYFLILLRRAARPTRPGPRRRSVAGTGTVDA